MKLEVAKERFDAIRSSLESSKKEKYRPFLGSVSEDQACILTAAFQISADVCKSKWTRAEKRAALAFAMGVSDWAAEESQLFLRTDPEEPDYLSARDLAIRKVSAFAFALATNAALDRNDIEAIIVAFELTIRRGAPPPQKEEK